MTTNVDTANWMQLRPWIGACLLSLLVACGGGGGGGTPAGGDGGPEGGSGSIGITVGDSPADDFDEILLTVSRVELIGGESEEPVVLSEEVVTFDLLALDAATELLVAADDVPASQYSKIRLQVDEIELRRVDEDGELLEEPVFANLVANGKLDLNPRGPFSIVDGGAIIVQLDIDARRSFLAVQTGAGQIRFRPVVFVDILGDGDLRRITFLGGNINLLAAPEGDDAFDFCNARPLTGRGAGDRQLDACRRVQVADDAAFFDADGEAISLAEVDDQAPAIVGGRIVVMDGEVGFEALLVQLGDRQDFKRIAGVISGDVVDGQFLLLDGRDAEDSGIDVSVQPGALIFDQHGNILEPDVLANDLRVRAMGPLFPAGGEADRPELRATAIAVDADSADAEAGEEVSVQGSIAAVADGRVDLDADMDAAAACVLFGSETHIIVNELDGDALSTRDGDADDLQVGRMLEAIGSLTEGEGETCLAASELVVETEVETEAEG